MFSSILQHLPRLPASLQLSLQVCSLRLLQGLQLVFRDPGFGLFGARVRDSKEYWERDLALLQSGIREIVALKPQDPEFLTAKK